jgi:hypothetical protein
MARTVNICWHAQEDGRGRYNSTAMLNDMFDFYDCRHHGAWAKMPNVDGAVVVVHGGRELGRFEKLQSDIEPLKWCLLIYLGDEESSFPAEKIKHPNSISWVQEPIPGRHDFAKRFIVNGYGHGALSYIMRVGPSVTKDLDWFFGGQETHERRRACVDALREIDWGGITITTKGYHQGISLMEYYRTMCRARIVPCPSGLHSPDAARAWDALECGAIPILDNFSPMRNESGFWEYVLGNHPLPTINDWNLLPAKIEAMKIRNTEQLSAECQKWWFNYKNRFWHWLSQDIKELTGVGVECIKI